MGNTHGSRSSLKISNGSKASLSPNGKYSLKNKSGIPESQSSENFNEKDYPEFLLKLAMILERKSLEEENKSFICETTFSKYVCMASQTLGKKMFTYFLTCINRESQSIEEGLSCQQFVKLACDVLMCHTETQQLLFYIKVFSNETEVISSKSFLDLVATCQEVSQYTCSHADELLSAVTKAAMHGKETVSCKYASNWLSQHVPRITTWMHRYVCHNLTVGYSSIPRNVDAEEEHRDTPVLDCPDNSSCARLHPSLIWLLSCTLPSVYLALQSPLNDRLLVPKIFDPLKYSQGKMLTDAPNHWVPLYNSDNHGLSINRFQHHVFDYHGPSIMLITTDENYLFCVAVDEEWRDSKHFFGSTSSLCLQLIPEYKIVENNPKMVYYNQTSRGFPTGFQIGSDSRNRTLTLNGSLSLVEFKSIPYRLKSLEVWGCGSERTKEKQSEFKRLAMKDVESHRKVKVHSSEWVENPDRYLLELAGRRPSYADYN